VYICKKIIEKIDKYRFGDDMRSIFDKIEQFAVQSQFQKAQFITGNIYEKRNYIDS
jgi:hypothetical protein